MAGWKQGVRTGGRRVVRAAARLTADLRAHPDLVVIGVKRGGTTSLFRDLERHPAMLPLVPSARWLPLRENQKGVHFFDTNYERGARWYRSHFATGMTRWRRARRAGCAFTAEASPYYFFQPRAAQRVAAALPEATFLLLLRDPVERTISHWSEQTRNGVETLSLADALAAETSRVGDDGERLAAADIASSNPHEQQSYAAQSEYAVSLQRWFDAVGRDRIIVSFSEDYYRDASLVLDPIAEHLGVERFPVDVGTHRNAAPRAGSIDTSLEADLIARFQPDVDRVAEMLGVAPPWPRFTDASDSPPESR